MVGQVHAMSSSVAAADGLSAATRSGMTLVRLVGQLAFAEQPVVEPGQVAFHVIAPGFAIEYAVTLPRVHDHFYRLAMRMEGGEVLQSGEEEMARNRWSSLHTPNQQNRGLENGKE